MPILITWGAAFLIAVLSGMGVGSGGLLVVYLTLLCDMPQIRAQGVNLAFFLLASGASMILHFQRRKFVFGQVWIPVAAGLIASIPGTYAALLLPEDLVRKIFGGMLLVSGVIGLFRKPAAHARKY